MLATEIARYDVVKVGEVGFAVLSEAALAETVARQKDFRALNCWTVPCSQRSWPSSGRHCMQDPSLQRSPLGQQSLETCGHRTVIRLYR
jgi:hypothetical protein